MRRSVVGLALSLMTLPFAVAASAQDEPAYAPALEAHRPGRWSLQFEVGPDFVLSNFDGAGIAATKNTSGSSAWRLGFTVRADASDMDVRSVRTGSQTFTDTEEPSSHLLSIGLDLFRLKRFQPGRRVGFEIGVGPELSYAHQEDENVVTSSSNVRTEKNVSDSAFFGAAGRLGVEVLLARSLSVHAHYGVHAGYQRWSRTREQTVDTSGTVSTAESELTQNHWLFEQQGVVLGLSVYL